jgi:hypothetical protein
VANSVQIAVGVTDNATAQFQKISAADQEMNKQMIAAHEASNKAMKTAFSDNIKAIDTSKYQEQYAKLTMGPTTAGFAKQSAEMDKQIALQRDKLKLLAEARDNADNPRSIGKYAMQLERQNVVLAEMEQRRKALSISPYAANLGLAQQDRNNMQAQRGIDNNKYKDGSYALYAAQSSSMKPILEQQAGVVNKAADAHRATVAAYGAESSAAKTSMATLLAEKKMYSDLEKEISNVNKLRREKITGPIGAGLSAASIGVAAVGGYALSAAISEKAVDRQVSASFGSRADDITKYSQQMREEFGLNETEVRKSASSFNMMLQSMGLTNKESYEMSTGFTKLSSEVAAFYGISSEDATEKLRAGLMGRTRGLVELGVAVSKETINNYAYTHSIADQGATLTESQTALASYAVISEKLAQTNGTLAATMDGPAGQLRMLKNTSEDLAKSLGNQLLPDFLKLVQSANSVASFGEKSKGALDGAGGAFAKFGVEAAGAIGLLRGLGMVLGFAVNPWVALAITVGLATQKLEEFLKKKREVDLVQHGDQGKNKADVYLNPDTGKYEKDQEYFAPWGTKLTRRQELSPEEVADMHGSLPPGKERAGFANLKGDNPSPDLPGLQKDLETKRQTDSEAKAEADRQAEAAKELAASRLQTERQLQNELFKMRHQGAYATFQDDLQIQMEEINLKEKEAVKIIGAPEAKQYYDQIRVETQRIADDKIRKSTEDLNRDIYKITHSSIEAQIADIEHKKAESIRAGIAEADAEKMAAAEKAKLQWDSSKEIQGDLFKSAPNRNDYQSKMYDLNNRSISLQEKYGKDDLDIFRTIEQEKTKIMEDETRSRMSKMRALTSGEFGEEVAAVKDAILKGKDPDAAYEKAHKTAERDRNAQVGAEWSVLGKQGIDPTRADFEQQLSSRGMDARFMRYGNVNSYHDESKFSPNSLKFNQDNTIVNASTNDLIGRRDQSLSSVYVQPLPAKEVPKMQVYITVTYDEAGNEKIIGTITDGIKNNLEAWGS